MAELKLEIQGSERAFAPGATIKGALGWQSERPVERAELRLLWYTQGKGSQDVEVVERLSFDDPKPEEARPFTIRAPLEPYSFSGKLISLIWALELVLEPGKESTRLELTIAPNKEEILLRP